LRPSIDWFQKYTNFGQTTIAPGATVRDALGRRGSGPAKLGRMPLDALTPRKLHDRIGARLVELLLSDGFRPGDRLPSERELATLLSVSRGSLRQALVALELDGVVEIRSNSGAYVAPDGLSRAWRRPSGDAPEVPPLDIVLARLTLEPQAARRAATCATDAALVTIAASVTRFADGDRRYDLRHPEDRGFHVAIAAASGNAALARLVVALWDMQRGALYERLEDHFSTAAMRDLAIEDHRRISTALARRDPEASHDAMHAHIERIHVNLSTGELGPAQAGARPVPVVATGLSRAPDRPAIDGD